MKNFEMPKMNISIFSSEDIITTSVTNTDLAKRALAGVDGLAEANVTVTTAEQWIDAN